MRFGEDWAWVAGRHFYGGMGGGSCQIYRLGIWEREMHKSGDTGCGDGRVLIVQLKLLVSIDASHSMPKPSRRDSKASTELGRLIDHENHRDLFHRYRNA